MEGHFPPAAADDRVDALAQAAGARGLRIANLGTYYGRPLPGTAEETEAEVALARRGMDAPAAWGPAPCASTPAATAAEETGFALVPFFRQVAREAEARGGCCWGSRRTGGSPRTPRR